MIDLIRQLFTLWEVTISVSVEDNIPQNILNTWDKLLWQIEIDMLLSTEENTSYLNALKSLSNRIYQQYKKQHKLQLHSFLERLERILTDNCSPSLYKKMFIKINMSGLRKQINMVLSKLAMPADLEKLIDEAVKETIQQGNFSTQATELLSNLIGWLEKRKLLTTDQLMDHLIFINFNHPLVIEYIISHYNKPPGSSLAELAEKELYLMERQRYTENIRFQKKCCLCVDHPSLVTQLNTYLKLELKWLKRRGKQLTSMYDSGAATNLPLVNGTLKTTGKRFQIKWPGDKSDLVELAYALYVYMRARGSRVTIGELANWFEEAFGISLSRYSHRFAEIKMRKSTRPSKFLDALVEEFLNYVEAGDAFFPQMK